MRSSISCACYLESKPVDMEGTSEQTTHISRIRQQYSSQRDTHDQGYTRDLTILECHCMPKDPVSTQRYQHVTFMPSKGSSMRGVRSKKPSKLGFSTRFPPFHQTRNTTIFTRLPIPTHSHLNDTPLFTLNPINNTKRNGRRKRYARPQSQADAPLARAKMSRLTTSFTGKTGGKTGGKAGGDSTGKTQKSHSAKAGLQVRCGMRFSWDGMGRKRVQAAAMDPRVSTVCAQSLRADELHATAMRRPLRAPQHFTHRPPS